MKFPSKLTTFEQFLYFDDYLAYPNTIGCRLSLTGEVDEAALEASAEFVCHRNPMMAASITEERNKLRWIQRNGRPSVHRLADHYTDQPFLKRIDLTEENGGQLHWATSQGRSSLSLLTHHAAADGIGGLQVVSDLLAHYAAQKRGEIEFGYAAIDCQPIGCRRVELDLLDRRGSYGFGRWQFISRLHRQLIGLAGVREFLANKPKTLTESASIDVNEPLPQGYPGLISRNLGDIDLMRSAAANKSVTANEMIVQAVFSGVASWRKEAAIGSERDLLRMMVPVNLRTVADRYLPACHRSSMISLDRVQASCFELEKLLGSIRFQMNVIKGNELGFTFLHMLNLYRCLPGGLKKLASPQRIGSTIVVTNLGEPFRRSKQPRNSDGKLQIGNLTLDSVELLAPLRPNTQAAFAIGRYAGATFLSMTYDNRLITAPQANDLMDRIQKVFVSQMN